MLSFMMGRYSRTPENRSIQIFSTVLVDLASKEQYTILVDLASDCYPALSLRNIPALGRRRGLLLSSF